MRVSRALAGGVVALVAAVGLGIACSNGSSSSAPGPDASSNDASSDAPSTPCASGQCDLSCAPTDTWFALSNGPGRALGDSEPATPDEVGDGMWHLFSGVDLTTDGGTAYVLIYDSTSPTPEGPYTLAAAPLNGDVDTYDAHGKETPSYLRVDAHTEMVFYTGDTSHVPLAATVAALQRVDGGAWTKLGPVAPYAPGETVQIDPTVAYDPATTRYFMIYESLTQGDGGAPTLGLVSRFSSDPTSFPASSLHWITPDAATLGTIAPARAALSFDPYAHVWRTAFDLADYPSGGYAYETRQTWAATPLPPADALTDAAPFLHDGDHALHPTLHLDGTLCTMATCPQGAVLQPSKAIYPDAGEVIFFYSGWSTLPGLQVNGQRCNR